MHAAPATSKHAVLGLQRSLITHLKPHNIRINSIAPSWTATGLVPHELRDGLGGWVQGPDVVAKSTAVLMADKERNGQLIYSWQGRYLEIERAPGGLLDHVKQMLVRTEAGGTDADKMMAAMKGSMDQIVGVTSYKGDQ